MNPIFKEVGGIKIGQDDYPEFSLTTPFATLLLYDDKIVLNIDVKKRYLHIYLFAKLFKLNQQIVIPLKKIDFVKRVNYFPVLADGIRIYHNADAPKYIIFWSLWSVPKIISQLREKGVKIGDSTTIMSKPFNKDQKRYEKYPAIKYFFLLTPFLGAFIAWKITGVAEIGIFMLVGSVINIFYYLRNKNK